MVGNKIDSKQMMERIALYQKQREAVTEAMADTSMSCELVKARIDIRNKLRDQLKVDVNTLIDNLIEVSHKLPMNNAARTQQRREISLFKDMIDIILKAL